jgi:hypothetical protein
MYLPPGFLIFARRDVPGLVAQRRNGDREDVETEPKVLSFNSQLTPPRIVNLAIDVTEKHIREVDFQRLPWRDGVPGCGEISIIERQCRQWGHRHGGIGCSPVNP